MSSMPVTIQERIPMAAARPGASSSALTAGDILRILKQRIFMILTIWILVSAATVATTLVLLQKHPLYRAAAVVLVESPHPRAPMGGFSEMPISTDMMNRYIQDQKVLAKDEQVLRDTLSDAAVAGTGWYREQPDKSLILTNLKDKLSVEQVPQASYLLIGFSCSSPKDAATIANTVVDKYLFRLQAMSQDQWETELQGYRAQEATLLQRLQKVLDDKQTFVSEKLGTPGVTEGINVVGETMRSYAIEIARAEELKLQNKAVVDNLSGVDPDKIAISPAMAMMIQQDPQVAELTRQLFALSQQRDEYLQQVGPRHRMVQALDTRLSMLDKSVAEITARREKEIREYQLNDAHTTYLNAAQMELTLRERMLQMEARQRDLDRDLAEYRRMDEDQALITNELNQIRDYIGRVQLVIKDRDMVRVRRIGQATPPLQPYFPQLSLMIPAGVLLGLVLGVGLAVMLELIDTSVRTPRDIIRHIHVPILGTVPDLDDEEVPIERIELAVHTAPRSMVAEAFRSLRTNLLLSSSAERQRTLLVTSAKPEEGKTCIAVNLAISLGQSGRRVLLVDANFHRPTLHRVFSKSQRQGLSNALVGRGTLQDLVQNTDLPNVDVITTGPTPPNPAELLASSYLRELIAEAGGLYDQIIFDGPPVLLMSDGLVLASTLDGAILVCRARLTSRGVVQRAREQIERVNGRIFGAVLNAAAIRRGGYFREQIRTYYDYQSQEAIASEDAKALPEEPAQQA